jgi:hypothetical protein
VVIPHYNNAEGGHHDTRFCYLGETRLNTLEQQLDDGEYVLGVDEHTGIVIDLNERTAEVVGNGVVTLRVKGNSTTFASGEVLSLEQLQNPTVTPSATPPPSVVVQEVPEVVATSLVAVAQQRRDEFESALAAGDANGATRAVLELENDIKLWSADTLTGSDADAAREILRSMIVKLGTAATGGLEDPRERVAPYVEALLAIRKIVRAEKRFDLSDIVRDALALAHIEVRDTPDGVEWLLQVPE